jgi:hypothetical protein
MSTATWRLYTYDVWGNANDGYEVNDVYPKQTLEIDGDTDAAVIAALERSTGGACTAIEVDWNEADTIYLNSMVDGKPLGELRRVDESEAHRG